MWEILRQNYIILEAKKFKKFNENYKEFLSIFFKIEKHEIFDHLLILKKREKYLGIQK